jgi:hypothetical protein
MSETPLRVLIHATHLFMTNYFLLITSFCKTVLTSNKATPIRVRKVVVIMFFVVHVHHAHYFAVTFSLPWMASAELLPRDVWDVVLAGA